MERNVIVSAVGPDHRNQECPLSRENFVCGTFAPADDARGIAHNNKAGRDVTNDDGPCAKDGEITHFDIRTDEYVGAYPSTPPNRYRALDKRQVRSPVVVRSGTKMRALGDRCLRADADLPEIIDLNALTNSNLVFDKEIPRYRDPNRPVNTNLTADPGSEQAQ